MIPETRYASSAGVSIAYQTIGHGPIDIVAVPGWVSNLDAFWEEPFAFAFAAHKLFTDDIIDIFAGRVYKDKVSPGLQALRRTLAKSRMKKSAATT